MIMAIVCRRMDMPIAVISGAKRGLLRSGHLLDAVVQGRGQCTGDEQGDDQHQPGRQQGLQDADDRPAHQGADHKHLAMGEVDQADDAVDHGVAQRDQGVHAAQHQAVDDLLKKDVHMYPDAIFMPRAAGPAG
jgi:hypothetical protein